MNPTKLELIEQLKQGKALHYDIDNVELLNEVLQECSPKDRTRARGILKYYSLCGDGYWTCSNYCQGESIPLSSFIDHPKMIEVERVNEFIHKHVFYQDNDELIDADQLLTFLNTQTND